MFKVIVGMKKRDGMTREDFMRYYKEKHIPYGSTLVDPAAARPLLYVRNFVTYNDPLMNVIGAGRGVVTEAQADFDVLTELGFASREEAASGLGSLFEPVRFEKLVADEQNLFRLDSIKIYAVEVDG